MENKYDSIIIGGGVAGITAGIYLARKKIKVMIITKDFLGSTGKTSEVDNFPGIPDIGGMELAGKFEEHLRRYKDDIEIVSGREVVKVSKEGDTYLVKDQNEEVYETKTVIVATGRDPRPLEVDGEKDFIGKGVTYCSICDAPIFQGKDVLVVGGGNSGFESAIDLLPYANNIILFERGGDFKADEILQDKIKDNPKVKTEKNVELLKIEGNVMVEKVRYRDIKTGEEKELSVGGVFVQVGSTPATGFLKGLVEFNKWDEVIVDPVTYESSSDGLYAVGDINEGRWKQIVNAAGEGCIAALEAYEKIKI